MLLLQSSMPCSQNFNRYKEKFHQFLVENPDDDAQPRNQSEIQLICSPTMIKKLSPLSRMQLADVNINPEAHAKLLQVAAEGLHKKASLASKKFSGEINLGLGNESARR